MKFILPKFYFKIEKWKWNSDYRVYVSNKGHFKNEFKQELPVKIDRSGYCRIKTNCGYKLAHRLVMLTWKPIPDAENLTVDHLDHNKRNNSLENLEWVSKEENLKRATEDFLEECEIVKERAVIGGGRKFNSFEEAIDFVILTNGIKNPNRDKVKKNIKKAIVNKNLYCGREWKEC